MFQFKLDARPAHPLLNNPVILEMSLLYRAVYFHCSACSAMPRSFTNDKQDDDPADDPLGEEEEALLALLESTSTRQE